MLMAGERYERIDLLYPGNMSEVWLARDMRTHQEVALKILKPVVEDDQLNHKAQERFQREIKIARSLKHQHILPLLDSGWTHYNQRKVPFLISPYMPERSLASMAKKQAPWQYWTLVQTGDAILQAAQSLWYLHARQPAIIHGDVKPGNFLVRAVRDAQPTQRCVELFLFDFGIAHLKDVSVEYIEVSDVIGTYQYMAPEQVNQRAYCASDQYSLAIMACWMLTGRFPINVGNNPLAHVVDPPLAPSQLNAERIFSSAIDAVILRALAKDPEQRFPTVLAFAQSLQQAIEQQASEEKTARTISVDLALDVLPEERSRAPEAAMHPRYTLPPEQMQFSLDPIDIREGQVLDEPIAPAPVKAATTSGRREISGRLYTPLALQTLAHFDLPARLRMLSWQPQGEILACALYGEPPCILSRNGPVEHLPRVSQVEDTHELCWSPDGRILALSKGGEVRFWDRVEQRLLPLVMRFQARSIVAFSWSSTWNMALWIGERVVLYALPLHQLHIPQPPLPVTLSREEMSGSGVLCWSPDGKRLVAGTRSRRLMCWRIGQRIEFLYDHEDGEIVRGISWAPDSSFYAVAFRDNRVEGWERSGQQRIFQWSNLPSLPRMVSIAPDGRVAVVLNSQRTLFGFPGELAPLYTLPVSFQATWSPTRIELAALDEGNDTRLTIWGG